MQIPVNTIYFGESRKENSTDHSFVLLGKCSPECLMDAWIHRQYFKQNKHPFSRNITIKFRLHENDGCYSVKKVITPRLYIRYHR